MEHSIVPSVIIKTEAPENEEKNFSLVDSTSFICRICLGRGELRLFEGKQSLWNLFLFLTKIDVHSTIDFPRHICKKCINKLESISLFIDVSRKTNSYFGKNVFSIKVEDQTLSNPEVQEYDNERSKYCRACLSSSNLSLFEEKLTLLQLFQDITEIDVRNNTDVWNVISICSKCINELEKALNFLNLSMSNNELLERLATVDTKKEVLSTGDDGIFESIMGRNDLKVGCTDKYTASDIKEGILDDSLDRNSESSIEAGENKPFHTSFDMKEDILGNDLMFYCGPNDLESCTRTLVERKLSDNNQEQIEVGTETDQQKSPKDKELQPIEEKPFKCNNCRRGFTQKSELQTHLLTHNREKPFKCDHCGKSFSDKRALRKHLFIHNEEKPYKCDCCGRTFADKSTLRNHLLTHTGERPFKCDFCSKEYSQKKSLQTHLLTHSRGKPFICHNCGKSFTYNSNLQRHLLTHTGEKPFKCDYCRKGFARNDKLQTHLLIHTK